MPSEKAIIASISHKSARGRIPGNSARAQSSCDPEEIIQLTESAGASVIHVIHIKIDRVDPGYYIGKGKVSEIASLAAEKEADLAVFDCGLSPAQQSKLEEDTGLRVVDRTQVILDIFAQRAKTNEGKLQVELAQLNYLLPRLRGRGVEMSRLGGGIGTRGPGEMKLETDRRRIKKRISRLNMEIDRIRKHRALGRKERSRLLNIALIGYTNSGKSTLMNKLTDSRELAENRLFSTLDSAARRIALPENTPAVIIDTVGFIRDLPHHLVAAFKATLEEVTAADILLNVMDASDPLCEERLRTVMDTLEELGAGGKTMVSALNKIDLLDEEAITRVRNIFPHAVPVSAKTGEGLDELMKSVVQNARGSRRRVKLRIPQTQAGLIARIHREANILYKRYENEHIVLEADAGEALYNEIKDYSE